jgi:hypothetical protein
MLLYLRLVGGLAAICIGLFRLFDFLDSGQPLTASAEDRSYVLPLITVPGWKQRFKKIC